MCVHGLAQNIHLRILEAGEIQFLGNTPKKVFYLNKLIYFCKTSTFLAIKSQECFLRSVTVSVRIENATVP